MKTARNLKLIAASVTLALGLTAMPAQASPIPTELVMTWSGLFTLLSTDGRPLVNTSLPYYYDPTWGYGYRTPIQGTMSFDLNTGSGSFNILPFEFFGGGPAEVIGGELQAIGNGAGDVGTLVLGNALFNGLMSANGMPLSIVWDAAGLFSSITGGVPFGYTVSGVGAIPASDVLFTNKANYPIGPALLATTTWNTTTINCTPGYYGDCLGVNPSGGLPLIADSTGGSPFVAGPLMGYSLNLDITTITFDEIVICTTCPPPPPIPVPAAVWLFGSGLLGLLGVSLRAGVVSG